MTLAKQQEHLIGKDPILASLCQRIRPLEPLVYRPETLFAQICDTIIAQQLSDKVATVLSDRVRQLFPTGLTPEALIATPADALRAKGISYAKIRALMELATWVQQGKLDLDALEKEPDETVMYKLVQVKGIGPWTAEMVLMFCLLREDVFSLGDLGLKTAISRWYFHGENVSKEQIEQIEQIAAKWKPYRTSAARILWRSLELKSVSGAGFDPATATL